MARAGDALCLNRLGLAPLAGKKSRFRDSGAHMLDLPIEAITLVSTDEAKMTGIAESDTAVVGGSSAHGRLGG